MIRYAYSRKYLPTNTPSAKISFQEILKLISIPTFLPSLMINTDLFFGITSSDVGVENKVFAITPTVL